MSKNEIIRIISIIIISLYLFTFTSINLFKEEYYDPPYNYLSKNWLNSPIKEIDILDNSNDDLNIKEYDNQQILIYYNSDSLQKDLNIFQGKYFSIKLYSPYKYCNFVGFFHKKSDYNICGKDSQGNDLYFPKDIRCPINLIFFSKNDTACDTLNIKCKYQKIKNDLYLVTSTEYKNGEIITQLRINFENKICANSEIDTTFNDMIQNYPKKICVDDWGYDTIYKKIGEENINDFIKENKLNNINIIKNENIYLSYRGYLGVDDLNKFSEHPVDHVTYAKKIAVSKNIILFISCFYFTFCSIFIFIYEEKNKYNLTIKILFYVYCGLFAFNFLYDAHAIFTYFRVKGIVSTVNLEGISSYKNGLSSFIIFDILILIGLTFDFFMKLYRFLIFRRNFNIINNDNNNN